MTTAYGPSVHAAGIRDGGRRGFYGDRRGISAAEFAVLFVLIGLSSVGLWRSFGQTVVCQVDQAGGRYLAALGVSNDSLSTLCEGTAKPTVASTSAALLAAEPTPIQVSLDRKRIRDWSDTIITTWPPPSGPLDPADLPESVDAAPAHVQLPPDVVTAMQTSYANSFPGGMSQERGGTLIRDADGNIRVVNETSGTSGTFLPDRTVGPGETILGAYHTHPYDASEGGDKGVSFSGADIAYANGFREPHYLDAGDKQFMITPTKATVATRDEINKEWDSQFKALKDAGKTIQEASAGATAAVAAKFHMAYYEGKNGKLNRV